ncbi:hypothetical protein QUH73_04415 [Labilibaculum sp. K2S]|uniref:hypothetical protein n=1 Tax=Labilibaculum sp. K2S TaxID=3056386 RepID=UPI0025A35537|nr:hypothetical protein [Labilibaculum sp. K2S]MDM8159059.1 hypothetical protein [Labilibaculum sp. K2S]
MENKQECKPIMSVNWKETLLSLNPNDEKTFLITDVREINQIKVKCTRLKQSGFSFSTSSRGMSITIKRVS